MSDASQVRERAARADRASEPTSDFAARTGGCLALLIGLLVGPDQTGPLAIAAGQLGLLIIGYWIGWFGSPLVAGLLWGRDASRARPIVFWVSVAILVGLDQSGGYLARAEGYLWLFLYTCGAIAAGAWVACFVAPRASNGRHSSQAPVVSLALETRVARRGFRAALGRLWTLPVRRMRTLICLLIVLPSAVAVPGTVRRMRLESSLHSAVIQANATATPLRLADVAAFDWDRVHMLAPPYTTNPTRWAPGVPHRDWERIDDWEEEGHYLLVFVGATDIVQHAKLAQQDVEIAPVHHTITPSRSEAVFAVRRLPGADGKLVLLLDEQDRLLTEIEKAAETGTAFELAAAAPHVWDTVHLVHPFPPSSNLPFNRPPGFPLKEVTDQGYWRNLGRYVFVFVRLGRVMKCVALPECLCDIEMDNQVVTMAREDATFSVQRETAESAFVLKWVQ